MTDYTASFGRRHNLEKSVQIMPVWTIAFVACVLPLRTLALPAVQQTTYQPVQKLDFSYKVQQNSNGNKEQFSTSPQSDRSRAKEFWMAQQEFPVPFKANVPLKSRPKKRLRPAEVARRADQGPDVATVDQAQSAGILEEDIDALAAESGGSPPTETIPLYECPSSYRATPEGDGTTFQIFDSGRWWTHNCQTGLVWDQTLCRCEYPPGTRWELDCRDFRSVPEGVAPGSFQQYVNGAWVTRDCSPSVAGLVWDQDSCRCVWGPGGPESVAASSPCDIMLNMTFDHGVEDTAKGSFVEVGQGLPLPTRSDPKHRPSRGGNRAAYFTDTALNIWYFSDNDMGSSLRLEFRFLQDSIARSNRAGGRAADSSTYQMFLSNGCNISAPGYMPPSVAIGYRAADQSYLLAFETNAVRKAIVCNRQTVPGQWHSVSLLYEDGTLVMRVDGRPCIISADFSGSIQKSPCPLTIGADPLDRQGVYRGYLDDLLIARNCQDPAQTSTETPDLDEEDSQDPVLYRAHLVHDTDQTDRRRPPKHFVDDQQSFPINSYPHDDHLKKSEQNDDDVKKSEPNDDDVKKSEPNDNDVKKSEPNDDVKKSEPNDDVEKSEPNDDVKKSEPNDDVEKSEPNDDVGKKSETNDNDVKKSESNDDVKKSDPNDDVKKSEPNDDVGKKSDPIDNDVEKIEANDDDVKKSEPNDDVVKKKEPNDNEVKESEPAYSIKISHKTNASDMPIPLISYRRHGEYTRPNLHSYSEERKYSNNSSNDEQKARNSENRQRFINFTTVSVSTSNDTEATNSARESFASDNNSNNTGLVEHEDNQTRSMENREVPNNSNITGGLETKDMNVTRAKTANHTDVMHKGETTSVINDTALPPTSRPPVALFRAAVGRKANPWEPFDGLSNHETGQVGLAGHENGNNGLPKSMHVDSKLNGHRGWDGGMAGHEIGEDGLATDNSLEIERNSSMKARDHDGRVNHPLLNEKHGYDELIKHEKKNGVSHRDGNVINGLISQEIVRHRLSIQRSGDNALISGRSEDDGLTSGSSEGDGLTSGKSGDDGLISGSSEDDGLASGRNEDDGFDIQPEMDDGFNSHNNMGGGSSSPMNEDVNNYDLRGVSTHIKKMKGRLTNRGKHSAGHRGVDGSFNPDSYVEDTQTAGKTDSSLEDRLGNVHQRRQLRSEKARPEVYSGIKYRPPSERLWYEFVRESRPLVSTFDKHDRRRYRNKTRETLKLQPHTVRNRNFSNEIYSRKPTRRYYKSPNPVATRREKQRIPVITMKRWYD